MCCPGCQAVAQAIVDNNLTDYYKYRTEVSPTATNLVPEQLQELALYDKPELQQTFVSQADNKHAEIKQASLILEGIVCAACVWLSERHVNALPGVQEFLEVPRPMVQAGKAIRMQDIGPGEANCTVGQLDLYLRAQVHVALE